MQTLCKYGDKNDYVTDVVLSMAVSFEIFGTEDTDTDEDNAKKNCVPLNDAVNGRGATGFMM